MAFLHVLSLPDGENASGCCACELLSIPAALMFGTVCTDRRPVLQLPPTECDTSSCELNNKDRK